MLILKSLYEFLKPALLPIAVVLIVVSFFNHVFSQFKNEREDFSTKIKEIQVIHDAEMKKILEAQDQERKQHEKNLKKLQEDLDASLIRHEEKLKELERVKEETSKKLLEKYKGDPTGLSSELGRITGIPVLIPSEKK